MTHPCDGKAVGLGVVSISKKSTVRALNWGCGLFFVAYDFGRALRSARMRNSRLSRPLSGKLPGIYVIPERANDREADLVRNGSGSSGKQAGSTGIHRLVKQIPLCPACDLENFIKALTVKELRLRQTS
ncbi:hypothetical protein CA54_15100 [Symmachiella macrocystis]|uniref:Uncharacterized protein n=1 Tax=Symmachiella macrocystis TaxID=2527985 RepID=A0A5C6BL31_9PLAN|nr:hypothetical protein CA54_15100 [Symmachiella macrocystis]